MVGNDIALMAHLLRRAGFGATRNELDGYLRKGYEATVEDLLQPEVEAISKDDAFLMRRYHCDVNSMMYVESGQTDYIDVLDAERTLVEVERRLIDAQESHQLSATRLEGLTATPLESSNP